MLVTPEGLRIIFAVWPALIYPHPRDVRSTSEKWRPVEHELLARRDQEEMAYWHRVTNYAWNIGYRGPLPSMHEGSCCVREPWLVTLRSMIQEFYPDG